VASGTVKSGEKLLDLLEVLGRNFAHGYSPTELVKATGLDAPQITRYVETLVSKGFAERIPETGRIRLAHRWGQIAVQIMNSLDQAEARLLESRQRLLRSGS
jgi:DNA-binding IclR family transcriptional regulator